jgi:hypothetical protein
MLNKKFSTHIYVVFLLSLLILMNMSHSQTNNGITLLQPPPSDISSGAAMSRIKVSGPIDLAPFQNPFTPPSPFSSSYFDPIISFEGINFMEDGANNGGSYHIPPDPIGAAGPNHVVSVVNTSIEWHTKADVQQNSQSLASFFSSLSPLTQTFDPKVIYDQYANRFLVVTLEYSDITQGDPSDTSRIFVAVSATSDPNGSWYFHAEDSKLTFLNPSTSNVEDHWADYPGFAVDDQAVFICNNMFTFGTTRTNGGSRLWIIDKGIGSNGFYDGGTAAVSMYDAYAATPGSLPSTTQPAHMYGTPPGNTGTFLVSYNGITQGGAGGQEAVQIIRVDNPLPTPSFSQQFVFVGDIEDVGGSFGFPDLPDAPQSGTAQTVEVNDRRTLNAVWRNNQLWISTTINPNSGPDVGQTTAHWWKLNTTNLNSITLADQGNVGGEDIAAECYTFFPSLAVNASGDMGIGFAASAETIFPGAYYTGRLSGDPAGTVQQSVTLRAGLDYYYRAFSGSRNRWGDYSGMSVDPSDDTFWAFNEYAITRGTLIGGEDGRWGTAWGNFALPLVAIDSDINPDNVPGDFALLQNYPNPFNPSTSITFNLPRTSEVRLRILNSLGEEVTTLLSSTLPGGSHTVQWDASRVSSGVYLFRLETVDFVQTRKMILMK